MGAKGMEWTGWNGMSLSKVGWMDGMGLMG